MAPPVRNASIVTARPIVPPPLTLYSQPEALTTGSQINEAAVGGPYAATELGSGSSLNKAQTGAWWAPLLDAATRLFNSFRPNDLRAGSTHNVGANYGQMSSLADYGFRGMEFAGGVAGMPASSVRGHRPEWNNLVPIIYGLRVLNPVAGGAANYSTYPAATVSQFTRPLQYTPPGVATLSMKGEVLS